MTTGASTISSVGEWVAVTVVVSPAGSCWRGGALVALLHVTVTVTVHILSFHFRDMMFRRGECVVTSHRVA